VLAPRSGERAAGTASRAIDLGSGAVFTSPNGGIAVSDAAGVRLLDADGRLVATVPMAVRYPRWLPDGSGLVAQLDVPGAAAAPIVVVERDGRVTALGVDLSGSAAAYLSISPDGRTLAYQEGATIVLVDRHGGAPARTLNAATLVGWDAQGRLLTRDGATLRALTSSGEPTLELALPPGAAGYLEARVSPDRSATIIVSGQMGWSIDRDRIAPLPADVRVDLWIGDRELLGRRGDGRLVAFDVRTQALRPLDAVLDAAGWRDARAISDRVLGIFTPLGGELRLVDLATGEARLLRGLPAASALQTLGRGTFLVTGPSPRLVAFEP
jgi:hypothetical protein